MQISYTIYAKQQPLPLVGDEHYPDGYVGITFPATPSLTYSELHGLIDQLQSIAREMQRKPSEDNGKYPY